MSTIDAALFYEDRIGEENEARLSFSKFWIIDVSDQRLGKKFSVSYKKASYEFFLQLSLRHRKFIVVPLGDNVAREAWESREAVFRLSYSIYKDQEMQNERYSSCQVAAIHTGANTDDFSELESPSGPFINKLVDTVRQKKAAKVVVHMDIILPERLFLQPFRDDAVHFEQKPRKYPLKGSDDGFLMDFEEKSDFIIQCPDGEFGAVRKECYLSCIFLRNLIRCGEKEKVVVDHSIDVVKPIMIYVHSLCFEMPETYDLNYAKRLLEAIDHFKPIHKSDLKAIVQLSLCHKFANETPNFTQLLEWLCILYQHHYELHQLRKMVYSYAANEFYLQLNETFPINARNSENPLFRQYFSNGRGRLPFTYIEEIFDDSFLTNVILR